RLEACPAPVSKLHLLNKKGKRIKVKRGCATPITWRYLARPTMCRTSHEDSRNLHFRPIASGTERNPSDYRRCRKVACRYRWFHASASAHGTPRDVSHPHRHARSARGQCRGHAHREQQTGPEDSSSRRWSMWIGGRWHVPTRRHVRPPWQAPRASAQLGSQSAPMSRASRTRGYPLRRIADSLSTEEAKYQNRRFQ